MVVASVELLLQLRLGGSTATTMVAICGLLSPSIPGGMIQDVLLYLQRIYVGCT